MKKLFLVRLFRSNYCRAIFVLSFLASYYLVPRSVFNEIYALIALLFMLTFALMFTCLIRNVKERIRTAAIYQSSSLIGIIASVLGIAALQVCGTGGPVCGASIGLAVASTFFPGFVVSFLEGYAIPMVMISVVTQLVSLYYMKCFYVHHAI